MKKIITGLIFALILFSFVGYSGFTNRMKLEYSNRTKYEGINTKDIKEEKVIDASGQEIGERASVTYNPDKITNEALSNFYKDKIKGSGYRYYTLINEKDKKQGIVSVACINVLTFGEIDDAGTITKVNKNFEVKLDQTES